MIQSKLRLNLIILLIFSLTTFILINTQSSPSNSCISSRLSDHLEFSMLLRNICTIEEEKIEEKKKINFFWQEEEKKIEGKINEENNYDRFKMWNFSLHDWQKSDYERFCEPYGFAELKVFGSYDIIRMCVWKEKDDISDRIRSGGVWKAHDVLYLFHMMSGRQNPVFIDIGSHIGTFTLLAAQFNATVIAVDPYPEHIDILQRNLYMNNYTNRVHIFRNAITYTNKRVYIADYNDNKNYARVIHSIPECKLVYQSVDGVTMDALLPKLRSILGPYFKVHFLKADVEPHFLMGAQDFLLNHEIDLISVDAKKEVFVEKKKCDFDKFLKVFELANYNMNYLNGEGSMPLYHDYHIQRSLDTLVGDGLNVRDLHVKFLLLK